MPPIKGLRKTRRDKECQWSTAGVSRELLQASPAQSIQNLVFRLESANCPVSTGGTCKGRTWFDAARESEAWTSACSSWSALCCKAAPTAIAAAAAVEVSSRSFSFASSRVLCLPAKQERRASEHGFRCRLLPWLVELPERLFSVENRVTNGMEPSAVLVAGVAADDVQAGLRTRSITEREGFSRGAL